MTRLAVLIVLAAIGIPIALIFDEERGERIAGFVVFVLFGLGGVLHGIFFKRTSGQGDADAKANRFMGYSIGFILFAFAIGLLVQ